MDLRRAFLFVAGMLVGTATAAQAPEPLRVKVFPGAQNLALWTGLARGTFAKHGVAVDLQFTQTSPELRDGLASGAFDIAHAAADNAIAMVEVAKHDVVFVMGCDSSLNELFVQPDVATLADMKGRTLAVDAPNTAYALQAMKILKNAGVAPAAYQVKVAGGTFQRGKAMLESRELAASTLNPPYSFEAAAAGLKSMGRAVDLLGPYLGSTAFAMRAWVRDHGPLVERYIAGYVEAQRIATDPANRDASVALLADKLKLSPELAAKTYAALVDPKFGLTPDAKLDLEGLRAVLAIRAELTGMWGGTPPPPEKYLELGPYERALARLK
jgi:ABC-type nitrate/sulfonate/bicarbonate transport system substrate-binding protein